LRQKLVNDQSQKDIEQRKKERTRREREKARELLKNSSAPEVASIPTLKTDDTPRKKKHVEFCEPLAEGNKSTDIKERKPMIKSKSFNVSLPKISEAPVSRKRTVSMTLAGNV